MKFFCFDARAGRLTRQWLGKIVGTFVGTACLRYRNTFEMQPAAVQELRYIIYEVKVSALCNLKAWLKSKRKAMRTQYWHRAKCFIPIIKTNAINIIDILLFWNIDFFFFYIFCLINNAYLYIIARYISIVHVARCDYKVSMSIFIIFQICKPNQACLEK